MCSQFTRINADIIADINNEITLNQQYKQNMISLNSFVMVKFTLDTMVQPIESEVNVQ